VTSTILLRVFLGLAAPLSVSVAQPPAPQRGVLDVLVFHAEPRDIERYPPGVRDELQRFVQRVREYRPRPRPAGLGSEMTMVYAAREAYEAKLVAAGGSGVERLAQEYVDALSPCYEWEAFHDCPEREAFFAEQYLPRHPDSPFREFVQLIAAHRWLCAADAYEFERNQAGADTARSAYQRALAAADQSRSALIKTAAAELKGANRCHAKDPFRRADGRALGQGYEAPRSAAAFLTSRCATHTSAP
jgi:hypothetical protein